MISEVSLREGWRATLWWYSEELEWSLVYILIISLLYFYMILSGTFWRDNLDSDE